MNPEKLNQICHELTNHEKAVITSMEWIDGQENPLERFGIPKVVSSDSPKAPYSPDHYDENGQLIDDNCVSYPTLSAVAASFNKDTARLIGENMGQDCRSRGIHVLYRPAVNIKRNILNGRNYEYLSEDPVLSGDLAASFIKGVQSRGTASCIKHYAAYSQEFERTTTNSVVSERALREIYLRAFQIAIEDADPWSLMTSYNKINGEYVAESSDMMGILRNELGYDGYIVSDARAIQDGCEIASFANGLDFELGYSHLEEIQDALDSGRLSGFAVDEAIRHTIEVMEKCASMPDYGPTDRNAEHELSRHLAEDCAVLLQNDGILPLPGDANIAVIGAMAKKCLHSGGGSAFTVPYRSENPYDELCRLTGRMLPFAAAYDLFDEPGEETPNPDKVQEAVDIAGKADIVIFFTALPFPYEGERGDRRYLLLPPDQTAALAEVVKANPRTVLVNFSGSPVDLADCASLPAILQFYPSGEAAGGAVAEVLLGIAEPGGRLPETFPVRLEDTPAFLTTTAYPIRNPNVLFGEDIFVGYRWYEKRGIKPLYPFGHGLSYTRFAYSPLSLGADRVLPSDTLTVSLMVKNTGTRRGSQVIQLYIAKDKTHVIRPVKELKAFEKVFLEPGEEKNVTFQLTRRAFEVYSEEQHHWLTERGTYRLLAGISSVDIVSTADVFVDSDDHAVQFHSRLSGEWVAKHPHVRDVVAGLPEAKQANFISIGDRRVMAGDPLYTTTRVSIFRSPDSVLTMKEVTDITNKLNHMKEE